MCAEDPWSSGKCFSYFSHGHENGIKNCQLYGIVKKPHNFQVLIFSASCLSTNSEQQENPTQFLQNQDAVLLFAHHNHKNMSFFIWIFDLTAPKTFGLTTNLMVM